MKEESKASLLPHSQPQLDHTAAMRHVQP